MALPRDDSRGSGVLSRLAARNGELRRDVVWAHPQVFLQRVRNGLKGKEMSCRTRLKSDGKSKRERFRECEEHTPTPGGFV